MSFKDLYEKYINNQASEEEIKIVEEEIEKNEIICEYLCNKIDDDLIKVPFEYIGSEEESLFFTDSDE